MHYTIIFVLFLHLIADFVLQPNWIQTDKSKNNLVLFYHVAIHFIVFFIGLLPWFGLFPAFQYALVNASLHFLIDFVSSRIISNQACTIGKQRNFDKRPLYQQVNLYVPCLFLGIDQWGHQLSLILTAHFLLS